MGGGDAAQVLDEADTASADVAKGTEQAAADEAAQNDVGDAAQKLAEVGEATPSPGAGAATDTPEDANGSAPAETLQEPPDAAQGVSAEPAAPEAPVAEAAQAETTPAETANE